MKQYFSKGFVVAAVLFTTVPAMAQNEKSAKEDKDVQTIVITRKGNVAEKTVVEVNGDKVLINGKEASKTDDVTVNVHKIKSGEHGLTFYNNGKGIEQNWNFDMNTDGVSLFKEDANRAMLGVETDVDESGATILKVSEESAAQKAGLKKGDVIIKVDDKKIDEDNSITEIIRSKKPGDKVTVTYLRDGKEQKLTTELGKWKGINMTTFNPSRVFGTSPSRAPFTPGNSFIFGGAPRLGLSIQDTDDGKGVKVIEVDEEGNAAKAGLKEDDIITHVNDKEINSADEISKTMKENKDKVSVRMQVLRAGKAQTIEVRIPRKLKTADL